MELGALGRVWPSRLCYRPSSSVAMFGGPGLSPHRVALILGNRDLIREMVRKEFSMRYHGSVLGIVWMQLYPVLLLAVYWFVFSVIFQTGIAYFPLYVF